MSETYEGQVDAAARVASLTQREREVLRLVARVGSSKRIAAELGIEPASVDTTLYRAMTKLAIKGRAAAAASLLRHEQAVSRNLDSPPPPPDPSRSCPVVDSAEYPLPDERDAAIPAFFEESVPFQADRTSLMGTLRRLLIEPGAYHDLTFAQRLRTIAFWTAAGVLLLCLLGIVMSELSRGMAALLPHRRM